MSKKKDSKKVVVIIVAVIICFTVAIFAVSTLNSHHIRHTIDSRYSAVRMPAWLYLGDKRYNSRSLWDDSRGVKESMTYDYLPVAKEVSLEDTCNIIGKSLTAAGYSVVETSSEMSQTSATLHATGKNLKLIVYISTAPAFDGSGPTSVVQSVGVQAYE